mmetsp:Transcript_77215/g.221159  ORF Transcript_77215/g.221159 Transcript_77215/m.221159 type:complete len:201 (+) Transcript_77215:2782-3384(+)
MKARLRMEWHQCPRVRIARCDDRVRDAALANHKRRRFLLRLLLRARQQHRVARAPQLRQLRRQEPLSKQIGSTTNHHDEKNRGRQREVHGDPLGIQADDQRGHTRQQQPSAHRQRETRRRPYHPMERATDGIARARELLDGKCKEGHHDPDRNLLPDIGREVALLGHEQLHTRRVARQKYCGHHDQQAGTQPALLALRPR